MTIDGEYMGNSSNSKQYQPLIFISYAAADGFDFAKRLYKDLKNDNIKVWIDKKILPQVSTGTQRLILDSNLPML